MKPYFRGIEMYNDAIMVKVSFPDNWKAYPSDDEKIKVAKSDDGGQLTYYYADSNNTTYEEIFDLIEQTIKSNQDIVLKLKLLKDKVDELKELFSSSSYDDLLTLKFVIGKQNNKPKRKYVKKTKTTDVEDAEKIVDHD